MATENPESGLQQSIGDHLCPTAKKNSDETNNECEGTKKSSDDPVSNKPSICTNSVDTQKESVPSAESQNQECQIERRVLVVGMSGTGKTSLINVMTGDDIAKSSDSTVNSMINITHYVFRNEAGVQYHIIDTPGFDAGSTEERGTEEGLANLIRFLTTDTRGFNCVLFVARNARITKAFDQTHSILEKRFIKNRIPVIYVVTGCELDNDIDGTQRRLYDDFQHYKFAKIVCGTTLPPKGAMEKFISEKRANMRSELFKIIEQYHEKHRIDILGDGGEGKPFSKSASTMKPVRSITDYCLPQW